MGGQVLCTFSSSQNDLSITVPFSSDESSFSSPDARDAAVAGEMTGHQLALKVISQDLNQCLCTPPTSIDVLPYT